MPHQLTYFKSDFKRMLGRKKIRLFHVLLSQGFWGILVYRIERSIYLLIGKRYDVVRILFLPLLLIIRAYSNLDLNYKSDIKGGLSILHPSLGVVINGVCIIGENLTLTGGNVIGINKKCNYGDLKIGNNCNLGANAVIIGPLELSDNIKIGALACVTKSFSQNNITLVGTPARPLYE